MDQKKRHMVSFEKMSEELAAEFAAKYPNGQADYLPDLERYPKPDGTSFFAVTMETEDAIYLVKIKVETDDVEDIERWLDGDDDSDDQGSSSGSSDSEALPDDNISQYGDEETE